MCKIFAGQNPSRYESVTRRIRLNGQSTSVRLERAFWGILDRIAMEEGVTTLETRGTGAAMSRGTVERQRAIGAVGSAAPDGLDAKLDLLFSRREDRAA